MSGSPQRFENEARAVRSVREANSQKQRRNDGDDGGDHDGDGDGDGDT